MATTTTATVRRKNARRLLELYIKHDALFTETSPAPVKFAASLLGLSTDEVRLPLVSATEPARARIREAMVVAGLVRP